MYSRSKRGSNFLQESERSLLRSRRDTAWQNELASRSQLQAVFSSSRATEATRTGAAARTTGGPSAAAAPAAGGAQEGGPVTQRGSVADTVRRLSDPVRRKSSGLPESQSGLLPSASMGPLASAGALCAPTCLDASCVAELLAEGGPVPVRFNAINEDDVVQFLNANPETISHYVKEYVDVPTIKGWLSAKSSGAVRTLVAPAGHHSTYGEAAAETLRRHLLDEASHPDHTPRLLHELARVAAVAVGADGFTLFLIDSKLNDLIEYTPGRDDFVQTKASIKIVDRETPSALAAATGESLTVESITCDKRFPHGFGPGVSEKDRSALVVPLPGLAVLELRRGVHHEPFEPGHLEAVNAILVWFNIAINRLQLSEVLQHQQELNSFLLEVASALSDEPFGQEALISKVMLQAKALVAAERVTFFAMDEEKHELYASLFDDGQTINGSPVLSKRHEIRFPAERGIAGHCARLGQVVNVQDAYSDPRFNAEVDRSTGYRSRSLLAVPVKAQHRLLGVLQVVNKLDADCFSETDEASLKMFGIYCSLALSFGALHERGQKKDNQLSVALDALEYHTTASPAELKKYMEQPLPASIPDSFDTFRWAPEPSHDLSRLYLHMYFDLLGEGACGGAPERVVTFTTTVIKSYRRVAYHNATHAFMVAHTMYNILKRNTNVFSRLELLSLLVACICHDIDHRGYSNTYAKAATPLGGLYKASVMENHHFATAAAVLQRPGHDILAGLTAADRKEVLDLMYEAIIATDLAVYFQVRPKLESAMTGQFNMHQTEHRRWFCSVMMTACDLSAVCKAPEVVLEHTLELYVEFHEQGDNEKKRGTTPDPMMDRTKALNLPNDQINFIKYICMPAYELISKGLPNTNEMLVNVKRTLEYWADLRTKDASVWKPYASWPKPEHHETRLQLPRRQSSRSPSPARPSAK
ncbi:cAMP and cAMP-inhibited cGMP 3',5'-cyclic phosphodiesterase 10A-like isoform X1 [Amphibalanus amphitrite]|uniref:cAMP and cAMP-inhibited cGMP 3',5'-cyclic phosphodiesterase 10A-like isoform X1 n=1 Tax=Amphibalanus amphitrite TaxID=1232801 RepID=UPI001C913874|nr:cAMP and cAMP-inhibited cGMP 3',5'-cyclic phosphodiesterase 10A-like isoform X1 [Amphibalanus amphitrite]